MATDLPRASKTLVRNVATSASEMAVMAAFWMD